jgi:transposase InsO family protein
MRAELCTAALNSAVMRYKVSEECIIHSDRGSQFTSHLFRETLSAKGFLQSMGRTGSCYDNARMESFFATIKNDLIYRLPVCRMTREEVRVEIFEWIEGYYNLRRRHTSNEGNQPPLVKREIWLRQPLAA